MKASRYYATLLVIIMLQTAVLAQSYQPSRGSSKGGGYTRGSALMRELGFDFGKVVQGSKVSKKFYVINTGTDTLRIIDIKPG